MRSRGPVARSSGCRSGRSCRRAAHEVQLAVNRRPRRRSVDVPPSLLLQAEQPSMGAHDEPIAFRRQVHHGSKPRKTVNPPDGEPVRLSFGDWSRRKPSTRAGARERASFGEGKELSIKNKEWSSSASSPSGPPGGSSHMKRAIQQRGPSASCSRPSRRRGPGGGPAFSPASRLDGAGPGRSKTGRVWP